MRQISFAIHRTCFRYALWEKQQRSSTCVIPFLARGEESWVIVTVLVYLLSHVFFIQCACCIGDFVSFNRSHVKKCSNCIAYDGAHSPGCTVTTVLPPFVWTRTRFWTFWTRVVWGEEVRGERSEGGERERALFLGRKRDCFPQGRARGKGLPRPVLRRWT